MYKKVYLSLYLNLREMCNEMHKAANLMGDTDSANDLMQAADLINRAMLNTQANCEAVEAIMKEWGI